MYFGGIQKNSLIDYPGKLSCVLFLSGCNFNCPYCHNPDLARGCKECPPFFLNNDLFDFLEKRGGFLDGIVISGGEPTLQDDLPQLCEKIKEMGFLVKLDTNGSHPGRIKQLIESGLVDYIAMDIKTDPAIYDPLIKKGCNPVKLFESIQIIMESAPEYEFRTTCVNRLVDEKIIESIIRLIKGAKRYVLQLFRKVDVLHPEFFDDRDIFYNMDDLLYMKSMVDPWVGECLVR